MAWRRCGSLPTSLLSAIAAATRASSSARVSPSLTRCLPSPVPSQTFRTLLSNPRNLGELGCIQSLVLPFSSTVAAVTLTSHLVVDARACCELSQGIIFRRSCQDR